MTEDKATSERRIDSIRAAGALGIHVIEDYHSPAVFPPLTFSMLRNVTMDKINAELKHYPNGTLPLFSLSLIPPNAKILTYLLTFINQYTAAYLFDLRQDSPDSAARIIAGNEDMHFFVTGDNPYDKIVADLETGIEALAFMYAEENDPRKKEGEEPDLLAPTYAGEAKLFKNAAHDPGRTRGKKILAELSKYYDENPTPDRYSGPAFPVNEILTAVTMNHVLAISMPIYTYDQRESVNLRDEAMHVLRGACLYFQHQERGVELPITAYDFHQPEDRLITVLAATEAEVIDIAHRASEQIKELESRDELLGDDEFLQDYRKLHSELESFDIAMHNPENCKDIGPIQRSDYSSAPPRRLIVPSARGSWQAQTSAPKSPGPGEGRSC